MSCKREEGFFQSTDGVHTLRYDTFAPEGEPKGILQISHGMCEYIGRYADFAGFLCERGFFVCGNDHLGHGRQAARAGELGYFADKDGWKLLSEDLHLLTVQMKQRFPGVPYFLLGHSMGSFVARRYLVRYGKELSGAVIMGTSGGNPALDLGIRLSSRACRRHGPKSRSALIDKLSMGGNNRLFKGEHDLHSWLTKDREIRTRYASDPLCSFSFTVSGYRDLFSLLQSVSAPEWAEQVPKDLPILLTSGEDDPIGANGRGVRKVYGRLEAAGVKDVALKLYPGDRHEILNETDRKQVYADIAEFLESRL